MRNQRARAPFKAKSARGPSTGYGYQEAAYNWRRRVLRNTVFRKKHYRLFSDNYLERRIDSSELLPELSRCLT